MITNIGGNMLLKNVCYFKLSDELLLFIHRSFELVQERLYCLLLKIYNLLKVHWIFLKGESGKWLIL